MGGSWDSTNTADGDVAVFAPIDIDHADRLGDTIAEIAAVKAGIIKDGAAVVSARQDPTAEARAAQPPRPSGERRSPSKGRDFALTEDRLAVGGQLISVRGLAGTYDEEYLPLYGSAPGRQRRAGRRRRGVAPRRGEPADPRRHPRRGARAGHLARTACSWSARTRRWSWMRPTTRTAPGRWCARLDEVFDFDEWALVLGALGDKDVAGIVDVLAPAVSRVFATAPARRSARRRSRTSPRSPAGPGWTTSVYADLLRRRLGRA